MESKIADELIAKLVKWVVLGRDRWMRLATEDRYIAEEIRARQILLQAMFKKARLSKLQEIVLSERLGLGQGTSSLKTYEEVAASTGLRLDVVVKTELAALCHFFRTFGIDSDDIFLD